MRGAAHRHLAVRPLVAQVAAVAEMRVADRRAGQLPLSRLHAVGAMAAQAPPENAERHGQVEREVAQQHRPSRSRHANEVHAGCLAWLEPVAEHRHVERGDQALHLGQHATSGGTVRGDRHVHDRHTSAPAVGAGI